MLIDLETDRGRMLRLISYVEGTMGEEDPADRVVMIDTSSMALAFSKVMGCRELR
jgi:hypothetical protein